MQVMCLALSSANQTMSMELPLAEGADGAYYELCKRTFTQPSTREETRTPDNLIKSQMLYQLSYASKRRQYRLEK